MRCGSRGGEHATRDCSQPLLDHDQRKCFNCDVGHAARDCPEPDRRKPAGVNAVVKRSNGRGPPRAAHLLEDDGNDVVHTLMIDSEGFETVARRHRDIDLSDFPASRAGMTQREKKRAFSRATIVRNVFDALADDDDNTDNAALCPLAPQPCVVAETSVPMSRRLPTERRTQAPASKECLEFPLERRVQAPVSKECLGFPLTHDCVDDDKRRIQAPVSKECLGISALC